MTRRLTGRRPLAEIIDWHRREWQPSQHYFDVAELLAELAEADAEIAALNARIAALEKAEASP